MARVVAEVGQTQAADAHRVLGGHEPVQLVGDAVRLMLEAHAALAVTDDVRLGCADRQRCGAPEFAGLVVSDVDGLARAVADRVVVPGGDAVLVAVERPRATDASLADSRSELRGSDHVDPRRRRDVVARQHDHVLAGRVVKPAEAILEGERRRYEVARRWRSDARFADQERVGQSRSPALAIELELDRAAVAFERSARNGAQQIEDVGMHLVDAAQEDTARFVEELERVACAHEQAQPVVEFVGVAAGPRVEHDEFGDESFVAPVLMGEERLPHERRVLEFLDAHEQDGQVAGDSDRPQARELQAVLGGGLDLERGVRVGQQQARAEALEGDGLLRRDAKVAQFELGGGPREVDGALGAADIVVLLGQAQRRVARVGHTGRKDDACALSRWNREGAVQRAARIEYGAASAREPAAARDGSGVS